MSHFSRFVIDARHSALIQLRTHMCRLLSASSQTFRDRNVNITRICCAVVHARSGCVWRTNSAAAGLGKLELWVFGRSAPGDWFPEAQKMFDLYRNFGGSTCCRKSWIQMQTSCLIHMRPYSSSLVRVCVCVFSVSCIGALDVMSACHVCLSGFMHNRPVLCTPQPPSMSHHVPGSSSSPTFSRARASSYRAVPIAGAGLYVLWPHSGTVCVCCQGGPLDSCWGRNGALQHGRQD